MKKLLFLLLPLMVLSSCGATQPSEQEQPLQYKEATEDVVDIFGKNNFAVGEGKKYRFGAEEKDPALGFQTMTYTRDAVEYYAIRFTAALTAEPTSAVWTRNVYQVSSGAKATATADKPSSVFYTALYDGTGNRYTPEEVGTGYNCFAVYTMYDIPVAEADDYYIEAYLTVDTKTTKVGVASKRNHFSYPLGTTGYFLAVNGNGTTSSRIYKGNEKLSEPSNNNGEIWADLKVDETFILVNVYEDHLVTYNHETKMDNKTDFTSVSGSDMSKVVNSDYYFFYLSRAGDNTMYVNHAYAYYLEPGIWAADNAWFALYCFNDNNKTNGWMYMFSDQDHNGLYVAYIDKNKSYAGASGIFCRMKPERNDLSWDSRWNQTGNLTLVSGQKFVINAWDSQTEGWNSL